MEYIRGRYFIKQKTVETNRQAIAALERVVAEDPQFAEGVASLAQAHLNRAILFCRAAAECEEEFGRARISAARALAIDPNLASAISLLGYVKGWRDWDFHGAEQDIRRAIALEPNLVDSHQRLANLLIALGRFDEGIREARRTVELDPASVWNQSMLGWLLYQTRDYEGARAEARKALELQPDYWAALNTIRISYEQQGRLDEAVAATFRMLRSDNPEFLLTLREAYQRGGYPAFLRTLGATYGGGAATALAVGDANAAFANLEKAFAERDGMLIYLRVDPQYDRIRRDARFEALCRRVGLPPLSQ
jgi:tetratricopeptide (TPR) repeat protein